ncbi:DUF500-domain-containing protein [Salix suchowensis]|nr:DUF500-domain-containing protein [Salix suchowensis]
MSMLDKFRKGAQKAGIQATAFLQDSSSKVVSGSREFAHGSVSQERPKRRPISWTSSDSRVSLYYTADPQQPQSALNSIPKAVLQRARGWLWHCHLSTARRLVVSAVMHRDGGLGWGLQIGADITDFVIVLNSEDAVRAFSMVGMSPLVEISVQVLARSGLGGVFKHRCTSSANVLLLEVQSFLFLHHACAAAVGDTVAPTLIPRQRKDLALATNGRFADPESGFQTPSTSSTMQDAIVEEYHGTVAQNVGVELTGSICNYAAQSLRLLCSLNFFLIADSTLSRCFTILETGRCQNVNDFGEETILPSFFPVVDGVLIISSPNIAFIGNSPMILIAAPRPVVIMIRRLSCTWRGTKAFEFYLVIWRGKYICGGYESHEMSSLLSHWAPAKSAPCACRILVEIPAL